MNKDAEIVKKFVFDFLPFIDSSKDADHWKEADTRLEEIFVNNIYLPLLNKVPSEYLNFCSLSTDQRIQLIADAFKTNHQLCSYSSSIGKIQISAIIGSAFGESALDPGIMEGWRAFTHKELGEMSMPAFGLWQFTRTRSLGYMQFCLDMFGDNFNFNHLVNVQCQVSFLLKELHLNYGKRLKAAGFFEPQVTIDSAVTSFVKIYEVPSAKYLVETIKARTIAANRAFKVIIL